eukprot:TRINITY_DN2447_c0_g1_i19.p1 TRINITY_DN2447_c0_g1~~TRINITY_DN2447_c0_g1_i19.p1  ORF type:complete len:105 (-),score=18.20 TRINITY_DN2447_c0_g1_i19:99-413(-)
MSETLWITVVVHGYFFFFKQKTAYEIGVRLVGSEMCIRDRDKLERDIRENGEFLQNTSIQSPCSSLSCWEYIYIHRERYINIYIQIAYDMIRLFLARQRKRSAL